MLVVVVGRGTYKKHEKHKKHKKDKKEKKHKNHTERSSDRCGCKGMRHSVDLRNVGSEGLRYLVT